jgi:hypothetical protein
MKKYLPIALAAAAFTFGVTPAFAKDFYGRVGQSDGYYAPQYRDSSAYPSAFQASANQTVCYGTFVPWNDTCYAPGFQGATQSH